MNLSKHSQNFFVSTAKFFCIDCLHTYLKACLESLNDMCNCQQFHTSIFGGCMLPKDCIIKPAFSLHAKTQCPDVL